MQKTLTINVPDELWVNSFNNNLTKTYSYDGPESFWVVEKGGIIEHTLYTEEPEILDLTKNKHFIDLTDGVDNQLALAIILQHGAEDYTYTYVDESNYDGSIYKAIVNPRLQDYFKPIFVANRIELELILKDTVNSNAVIAKERKAYVEKYDAVFEFTPEVQTVIDEFLTKVSEFLTVMETAYPWKFIKMNVSDIPKIPVSLITIFSTLPDLR